LVALLIPYSSYAQIFETRANIINEYGMPFSEGETEIHTYIVYNIEYRTEGYEPFNRMKVYYFFPSEGEEICYAYKVYDPISHMENTIDYLNKHLTRISDVKWRDPETSYVYSISTYDDFCILTVRWVGDEK
jgi:hypothetical protein